MSLAAMLVTAGCYTGVVARDHELAMSGRGAHAYVAVRKANVEGELLEVTDDTAIVLKRTTGLVMIRAESVRTMWFRGLDDRYDGGRRDRAVLASFRRLSRFPGGMPAEVRAALLREAGQDSIAVQR